jgi:hypothetical protein
MEGDKLQVIEWNPIDPTLQIGLLKVYYEKKAAEGDLIEVG